MADRSVTDLREHDDAALVARMVARDEDAVRILFQRYGPIAFGLAKRILGSASLAEEVVQEVFANAWVRADGFDAERGNVRAWLLTQVHHRSVDVVRREDSQRRRDRHLVPERELPSEADDVVEDAWIQQKRIEVRHALAQLPDEQKKVLELAYFGGMTQREISDSMSVPLGTVKTRTMVGLKRLRAMMDRGRQER